MRLSAAVFFEALLMLVPIPASILMNRMLGPVDRGILANLLLIPSITATLVGCNWEKILRGNLVRIDSSPSKLSSVSTFFWALQFLLGVAASAIYILLNPLLYINYFDFAILATLIVIPLQLAANYATSFLVCLRPPITAYQVKLFGSASFLIATVLFFTLDKLTIVTAFFSNQIVSLSVFVLAIFILRNLALKIPKFNDIKHYVKQLMGSLPSHIVESIASQLDIFLVIRFVGFSEAGAYIAFRVLELPFKAVMLSVINVSSSIVGFDKKIYLKKFIYIPTIALLFISFLMFVLVNLIAMILNMVIGQGYASMYWILKYLFFVFALSNAYELSLNAVMMNGNQQSYFNIKLIVALIRIATLVCFVLAFGLVGVLYALIITAIVGLLLSITSLRAASN